MTGGQAATNSGDWVYPADLRPRWKYNPLTVALAKWYYGRKCDTLERAIFVATTGRSGTLTLADLCGELDGFVSMHEPHPIMNRSLLVLASDDDWPLVRRYYNRIKAINIRRDAAGSRYYLEANHLFIKTFADLALADFGSRLAVLHLVRPPDEVARSIYQLERSEIGTEEGNGWWLDFRTSTNLIDLRTELEDDGDFADPYYRALWYWYEIDARTKRWQERHPAVPFARITTEELSDPDAVARALTELGVEFDKRQLEQACGKRLHGKSEEKTRPPLEDAVAESMHARFIELLVEKGFAANPVPPTDS